MSRAETGKMLRVQHLHCVRLSPGGAPINAHHGCRFLNSGRPRANDLDAADTLTGWLLRYLPSLQRLTFRSIDLSQGSVFQLGEQQFWYLGWL